MQLTIIHVGGTEKVVEFEGLIPTGGWIQVRYPHGAGCYSFALAHGRIECKRGETALWRLADADLEQMRELAKKEKVKWRKPRGPGRPRKPRTQHPTKQIGLFE
jgi:hypothetical protein